jgi:serine/threonine protein phosphatase PrpC
MKCPNCGRENREIAMFCQYCGTQLQPAQAPHPATQENEIMPATDEVQVTPESEPAREPGPAAETTEPRETVVTPEPEPQAAPSPAADQELTEIVEPEPQVALAPAPDQELTEGPGTELTPVETSLQSLEQESTFAQPAISDLAAGEETSPERYPEKAPVRPEQNMEAEAAHDECQETTAEGQAEETIVEPEPASSISADQAGPPTLDDRAAVPEAKAAPPLAALEQEGEIETSSELEASSEPETASQVQELADADLLPWRGQTQPSVVLEPGTIVNGRYRVVEVLSKQEREVLYRVRDLQRCPKCGSADNSPDQAFCNACGAMMEQKPAALLLQRPIEHSQDAVEAQVEDHFVTDSSYWVWREAKQTAPLGGAQQAMRMIVGFKSDTGKVRELDEDSMLVWTMSYTYESRVDQVGLFVVADGMGGHEAGEVASQIAIQTLADVLLRNVFTPEIQGDAPSTAEIQHWMQEAVETANDQVYLERQKRDSDMGTTITVALVKDWTLHLAHVGDCRAYRWGEDGFEQLTTDHSIVASMIAAGTAEPEEIYTHPQRSVIYRCIGDRPTVQVDVSSLSLAPEDRLILCCDGLWEMIRNDGIQDVMLRESDPQTGCDIMVDEANAAGGTDNISVIVVQF